MQSNYPSPESIVAGIAALPPEALLELSATLSKALAMQPVEVLRPLTTVQLQSLPHEAASDPIPAAGQAYVIKSGFIAEAQP
jgi:hypothetical protein